ncbi:Hypothetical predicted protein [Mytilus galloprovincialis]|uniref:nicotinamidase n=1 Tax=Mytilus galloprovincialis TaxID=29158 RepID=A0A8B6GSX5_MYTGA|nr:Hypothetical predicted protein [Mytilus galloprovincialis]
MIISLLTGLTEEVLAFPLDEFLLENLSNNIGNDSLLLGLKLGLSGVELQYIVYQHKTRLIYQTREILKSWSKLQQPLSVLAKAFNRSLCDENNSCTEVAYNLTQHLWPDHCVINTPSANFSHNLTHEPSDLVVRKGYNCKVDSYSAFYDNGGFRHTELHDKLQEVGIDALIITGLARDYCVYYTAMDSKKLGYETYVVLDATRPVTKETGDSAVADMKIKGIQIIESPDVAGVIAQLTSDAKCLNSTSILMISIILCLFKCLIGM